MLAGIAGPGGLLAIVPTMYYDTKGESVLYILVFLVVSTIMMGFVALGWGFLTSYLMTSSKSDLVTKGVYFFSCGASIVVGILWIILNALDLVDEIFDTPHDDPIKHIASGVNNLL